MSDIIGGGVKLAELGKQSGSVIVGSILPARHNETGGAFCRAETWCNTARPRTMVRPSQPIARRVRGAQGPRHTDALIGTRYLTNSEDERRNGDRAVAPRVDENIGRD